MILLQVIGAVLFWGSLVWGGIQYGWQLPVIMFLFALGSLVHQEVNKLK